MVDNL